MYEDEDPSIAEVNALVRRITYLEQALAGRGEREGGMLDDPAYQGGSADLDIGGRTEQRILQASAQNNAPRILTAAFDVALAGDEGSVLNAHRPQARICWGSVKGQHVAVIDLITGSRIAVEAVHLTIDIALFGFEPGGGISPVGADAPALRVHCSVGYGSSGYGRPNTYTAPTISGLAAGANSDQRIPRYARRLAVKTSIDPYGATPPMIEAGFTHEPTPTGARFRSGPVTDRYVPVFSGAEAVRFTNRGSGTANVIPIYELSL